MVKVNHALSNSAQHARIFCKNKQTTHKNKGQISGTRKKQKRTFRFSLSSSWKDKWCTNDHKITKEIHAETPLRLQSVFNQTVEKSVTSSRLKGLWQCNKKTCLRTKLRELNSVLSSKAKVPEITTFFKIFLHDRI